MLFSIILWPDLGNPAFKFIVKAIGRGGDKSLFFTKINFGFYIKALSTNYKLGFTELKIIFNFWIL